LQIQKVAQKKDKSLLIFKMKLFIFMICLSN
jgi:hypothetical protein